MHASVIASFIVLLVGIAGAIIVRRWNTSVPAPTRSGSVAGLRGRLRGSGVTPFRVLAVFAVAAVYLILLPGSRDTLLTWPNTVVGTLLGTLIVLGGEADLPAALEHVLGATTLVGTLESLYIVVLFTAAPLITLGFILSFFRALSARLRYWLRYRSEVVIFTELNDQSMGMATSIRVREPKTCIVFASADERQSGDLVAEATRLAAICFRAPVLGLPLHRHSPTTKMTFFVMGSDSAGNLKDAVGIVSNPVYRDREDTHLYIFTDTIESELALRYHPGKIRVRRINPARTMVYDWLWRGYDEQGNPERDGRSCGLDLFRRASEDGEDKRISAVIVGAGSHGMEMLRALAWYCQMDTDQGVYRLTVDAFDCDESAGSRFEAGFPELARPTPADPSSPSRPRQDAIHDIRVHSGVDATSGVLLDHLETITAEHRVTFVFIALGDDSTNIHVASTLRRFFTRHGNTPLILTMSRQSEIMRRALDVEAARVAKTDTLSGAASAAFYETRPWIDLIGDTGQINDYTTVIHSDMEWNGLICHMVWAGLEALEWVRWEASFWEDEYPYSSSIAAPIAWRARRAMRVSGAELPPEQRSEKQREGLMRLEHARWNAFMRSEGFILADHKDTTIARTHYDLKDFDALPEKEPDKDDNDSIDALSRMARKLQSDISDLKADRAANTNPETFTARQQSITERQSFITEATRHIAPSAR